jgi:hypothetical protein
MFATMKRQYLALALGAALVALPVSIAMAAATDGNEGDDYPATTYVDRGDGGPHSGDYYDNTPYTTSTPGGDGYDGTGDMHYDADGAPPPPYDCHESDPCAPL